MLSEEEKAELREKVRKDFEREKEEQRIRAELEEQERAKERNRVAQEEQERSKAKLLAGLDEQEKAKVEDARHLKIVLAFVALIMLVLIGFTRNLEGTAGRQVENSRIGNAEDSLADNAETSPIDKAYTKCIAAGLIWQMCHEYSIKAVAGRSESAALRELAALCYVREYQELYGGLLQCTMAVENFTYEVRLTL